MVAGVEVSTDGGATWHPATGPATLDLHLDVRHAGRRDHPGRAPSTTAATSSTPAAGVTVTRRLPVHDLVGDRRRRRRRPPTDAAAVELGVKFTRRRRPATSPASASTRAPATPAPTSAACGRTSGHAAGDGDLHQRDGDRLAAGAASRSPVAVTAGTTYVASYHAPNGHYAVDARLLHQRGVRQRRRCTRSPSGDDGGNGVYRYGATRGFPTQHATAPRNYWVDVVFDTDAPADTTPPTVIAATPAAGATGVPTDRPRRPRRSASRSQPATIALTADATPAATRSSPARSLRRADADAPRSRRPRRWPTATTYTATVSGGTTDLAGNAHDGTDVTWSLHHRPRRARRLPVHASGTTRDARPSPTPSDTGAVELGVKFTADVDRLRSPASGSTRAPATPAPTSAASGLSRHAARHAPRSPARRRPAGSRSTFARRWRSPRHDLRRLVPRPTAATTPSTVGYFASAGVDNAPAARARQTPTGGERRLPLRRQRGFPTRLRRRRNYWVDVVFTTDAPPTPTPPTVDVATPRRGATGVPIATTVDRPRSARPSQPRRRSRSRLEDAGAPRSPAPISYDAPHRRGDLHADRSARRRRHLHGHRRRRSDADLAGNRMAADVTWSFTTGRRQRCPCTPLAEHGARRRSSAPSDTSAVELGREVHAPTRTATITGVRFYKGAGNTGTHIGQPVDQRRARCSATATFTGETRTRLAAGRPSRTRSPSPPARPTSPRTTPPTATTRSTPGYFDQRRTTTRPAARAGRPADGGNGVYRYGAAPVPDQTVQRDQLLGRRRLHDRRTPDTTPPTVTGSTTRRRQHRRRRR